MDRDFEKGVCRRCGCVMRDCEPCSPRGEFYHPRLDRNLKPHACPNAGKTLHLDDVKELAEFVRKRVRRRAKGLGVKV